MSPNAPLLVLVVLAAGVVLPAQQPPPRPGGDQPPITFKVEVNYVEIDAVVTDAQGNFVHGLTRDDFQILEEGRPQKVAVFSLVDIPIARDDPPLFAESPIEPDVRSNLREFDGRIFVIVLDDLHTHFARSARLKEAAREFVRRHLGANDVAAIVQTGGSTGGSQEFTGSRPRLLRAIDAFMGQKTRSATLEKLDDSYRQRMLGQTRTPEDGSEAERAHKARRTLSTLRSVADYMAGIRGRRKAVVFFSEGIDYDMSNPVQNRYATDLLDETRRAIAAATRANVTFYGVDPRGLAGLSDETMELSSLPEDNSLGPTTLNRELWEAQNSLRTLSDETGGFAIVNRNDFRDAFARIVQDNSSYYVLGYYSDDSRRDGRFRKVDVRVTRPGLLVRARKGYAAPTGRPATSRPLDSDTSADLRDALDSPVPVSGLGLTAFAAPLRGSGSNASVAVALEIDPARLTFTESDGTFADDIEVGIVAVDQSGKVRDGGRDLINLRLRPQTHEQVRRHGIRIMRRLDVPPGRYQLRIGARDVGSGATGSVLHDLDVPDFSRADLLLSGLFITSAGAARTPTANPDPEFQQVMPSSPGAVRTFARDETIAVFAEVYDNLTKPAHRVAIETRVLADDGNVVFAREDERRSEELGGRKGGYGHTATIPLKAFAPGRYVLRVEARILLAGGASVGRDVEFTVR